MPTTLTRTQAHLPIDARGHRTHVSVTSHPFNNGFFNATVHVHITSLKEGRDNVLVCMWGGVLFQHLWILNCAAMERRKGQEDHSGGQVSAKAE